jgi:hypothetical protein
MYRALRPSWRMSRPFTQAAHARQDKQCITGRKHAELLPSPSPAPRTPHLLTSMRRYVDIWVSVINNWRTEKASRRKYRHLTLSSNTWGRQCFSRCVGRTGHCLSVSLWHHSLKRISNNVHSACAQCANTDGMWWQLFVCLRLKIPFFC